MNNKLKIKNIETASPLINCQQLYHSLSDTNTNICIFEITIKSVNQCSSGIDDQLIIPNAKKMSIEEFSNPNSELPHMMPDSKQFEERISNYGITNNTLIILYEQSGIYASPRVWWMFKSMGHKNVYILNATISQWVKLGLPVENVKNLAPDIKSIRNQGYSANYNKDFFCNINKVKEAIDNPNEYQIVDARSLERFQGKQAEPRKTLRSGHIPNSINLPFQQLLSNGKFIELEAIKQQFIDLNIDGSKSIIFTCGSGVTACILVFAGYMLNYTNLSVYDGSWSEWGLTSSNNPIEK